MNLFPFEIRFWISDKKSSFSFFFVAEIANRVTWRERYTLLFEIIHIHSLNTMYFDTLLIVCKIFDLISDTSVVLQHF